MMNSVYPLSGWLVAGLIASLAGAAAPTSFAQSTIEPPAVENDKRPGSQGNPKAKSFSEKDVPRAKPRTPLEAALKDGIPPNAVARARVRDNLYALLATAADEKAAKRVSTALNRVYLTSGSPTIDLLMKRAIKAINAKKYARAIEFLDAVTELAPDYAEGWNRRAFAHYRLNDLRQAAGDLRRALALDPNHFRALDGLGTILRETGDEVGAYKVYQKLIEIYPFLKKAKDAIKELKRKVEGRGI